MIGKNSLAHLDKSFTSYEAYLQDADHVFSVDLNALNDSKVSGSAIVAMDTDEDGTRTINVSLFADSMTPGQMHPQHIHGTFDADGNPTNAVAPTLANDADGDGFIEVLEGVAAYGDVIVNLGVPSGGHAAGNHAGHDHGGSPVANAAGEIAYIQSFDIDDPATTLSPVTGTQYDADDLMPFDFREIVLHGQNVARGAGDGTDGEVNGTQDRYVPILPVAAGELEATSRQDAMALLAEQREAASDVLKLGKGADMIDAGVGDDKVWGGRGDDHLYGAGDNDALRGQAGDDSLYGGDGNDRLGGAAGDDMLRGNSGNDRLRGGDGDDMLAGGRGHDVFIFADASEGRDVISDFEVGTDSLRFLDDAGEQDMVQRGDYVMIHYGDESSVRLLDTDLHHVWAMS